MTKQNAISAQLREKAGKGTARQTRRENNVPAVIYGQKKTPTMIAIESRILVKALEDPLFMNRMITITANNIKHTVLPRDVQFHPVKDTPMHVDFLRVDAKTKIVVNIPVEFINEDQSEGLRRGGALNIVRHAVEMSCEAGNIPEKLTADLTGYVLGDALHISAIDLPAGATPTIDRDFTIATVAIPAGVKAALREEAMAKKGGAESADGETEAKDGENKEAS